MTTAYLLPCACGEKLRIDASQAGLDVRCRCGKDVKAPTLRGLSQLERVEEDAATKPPQQWGTRQRLVLIGSLIVSCGLGVAGWYWYNTPPSELRVSIDSRLPKQLAEQIGAMSAEELIETWNKVAKEELDRTEPAELANYHRFVEHQQRRMYIGLGIAAIGGLVQASSLVVGKSKPKPARP
jgi:hypothetical protein